MRAKFYKIALTATALVAPVCVAQAQEVGERNSIVISPGFSRPDVAGMRSEGDYKSEPIVAGPVEINASLATIAVYQSNALNQNVEQDDVSLTLTPRLSARTLSDRVQFQFGATGIFRRYASLQTENSEEFDLNASLNTQLSQGNSFTINSSLNRESEMRNSVGSDVNAAEPVDSTRFSIGAGTTFAFGNLRVSPSVRYAERSYDSVALIGGGEQDQSFRDTRRIEGGLSLGYQLSPLLSVFTAGSYEELESTNAAPGAQRDSSNFNIVAGVRGELTSLVIAEIAAGYRKLNYDLARYRDTGGATFRANVQWFATPLVSFRLQATQTFLNGGNADVGGILSSRFQASAYYDPLRNLRLASTITYIKNDFRDVDTESDRASFRLQAQYFLNRNIAIGGYATLTRQDVSGTARVNSFTGFTTGIGVILTP